MHVQYAEVWLCEASRAFYRFSGGWFLSGPLVTAMEVLQCPSLPHYVQKLASNVHGACFVRQW